VIRTAKQIEGGLPFWLRLSMHFWVAVDLVIGLVPFVGDVADAIVLANTRNAAALEAYLREKGRKNLRNSGQPIPSDPSDPTEFDRLQNEAKNTSQHHQVRSGPRNQVPGEHAPQEDGVVSSQSALSQPAAVYAPNPKQSKASGSFFRFGSKKKSRPTDVETGLSSPGQTTAANQGQQG
jgi:hypothetical protein